MLLWFGYRRAYDELRLEVQELHKHLSMARVDIAELKANWAAQIAGLENAADLYNRASARAERAGINQRTGEAAGEDGLAAVRRRRGGW